MADDRSLLDRTQSLVEEKSNALSRLQEKIETIESAQKDHSGEQKDLESKKTALSKAVEDAQLRKKCQIAFWTRGSLFPT